MKRDPIKLALAIAIILIAISTSYYFLIQLPKNSKVKLAYEQRGNCTEQASKLFESLGYGTENEDYRNHYNQKLDKCFIEIYGNATSTKEPWFFRYLIDVYDRKTYAEYHCPLTGVCTFCKMLDENCKNEDEVEDFIREYMEN